TVQDLLFHFPRAYQDLSDIRAISQLSEGALQTVRGEVVEIEGKHLPDGRSIVSVVLSDGGKQCLEGIWFNQPHAARRFRFGLRLPFSGKATWFRDHWQMSNPRVSFLDNPASSLSPGSGDPRQAPEPTSLVVPVYPLTEDLRTDQLRPILRRLVDQYAHLVPEVMPMELRQRHGFPGISRALEDVHFPVTLAAAQTARRRVLYEHFPL